MAKKQSQSGKLRMKNKDGSTSIFTQEACTKSTVQHERNKKSISSKGNRVKTVVRADGTLCTYKGPKRKKTTLRTGQTLAGTKRKTRRVTSSRRKPGRPKKK